MKSKFVDLRRRLERASLSSLETKAWMKFPLESVPRCKDTHRVVDLSVQKVPPTCLHETA